ILKKLNTELPYDLAIPLVGIYPKRWKARIQTGICTPMFIAALFTIAKRCPLTDWVNKIWCMHTLEYYLALKRNEVLTHNSLPWMDLPNIILSEISQTQNDKDYMILLI
ncbi:LORF2 protein, partial [Crocuta crocuta]